jgi:4-hydroxy-tetrahydrodipicolinate synthase
LGAAPDLPAVIYNSPYYGFETKAELFFQLRAEFPNLVGFKEFGGAASLSYACEHITNAEDGVVLMVGVDTQVYHGYLRCGAVGAITGIGNCLPAQVLKFVSLCQLARSGDIEARRYASELNEAFHVLSSYDEGPDLVLYYKYLLVLLGDRDYELHLQETDRLSSSQRRFAEAQLQQFLDWWQNWPGKTYVGA